MTIKRRTVKLIVRVYIPLALLAGLIIAFIWGNGQKQNALRYEKHITNAHGQFFNDLASNFSYLDGLLSKLTVTSSRENASLLFGEIWKISGECVATLNQIPAGYGTYGDLIAYLNQLGAYSYAKLEELTLGANLTLDDRNQIQELFESNAEIARQIQEARENGETVFSIEALDSGKFMSSGMETLKIGVENEEGKNRYPHLIYDGPFSDSAAKQEPQGLGGQKFGVAAAKEAARIALGAELSDDLKRISDQNGEIEAFVFRGLTADNRQVEIAITKMGGSLLWMRIYDSGSISGSDEQNLFERAASTVFNLGQPDKSSEDQNLFEKAASKILSIGRTDKSNDETTADESGHVAIADESGDEQSLFEKAASTVSNTINADESSDKTTEKTTVNEISGETTKEEQQQEQSLDIFQSREYELLQFAQNYLKDRGFDSMEASYWQLYDGIFLVNMIYAQDGVFVYNDQIKVWVEVDTGRIVGIDSTDYLFSHVSREIGEPALTKQQAQEKLAQNLEVVSAKRALIPVNAIQERHCYEFTCTYMDQTYLVYINADSGKEEEILRVMDSSVGKLIS